MLGKCSKICNLAYFLNFNMFPSNYWKTSFFVFFRKGKINHINLAHICFLLRTFTFSWRESAVHCAQGQSHLACFLQGLIIRKLAHQNPLPIYHCWKTKRLKTIIIWWSLLIWGQFGLEFEVNNTWSLRELNDHFVKNRLEVLWQVLHLSPFEVIFAKCI